MATTFSQFLRVNEEVVSDNHSHDLGSELPDRATDPSLVIEKLAELVDRLVGNARLMAKGLAEIEGCRILNEIAFTQVCFAFENDDRTDEICAQLIKDKSIWISGSKWNGQSVLRASVSNWSTNSDDVAIAVDAVRKAAGK